MILFDYLKVSNIEIMETNRSKRHTLDQAACEICLCDQGRGGRVVKTGRRSFF